MSVQSQSLWPKVASSELHVFTASPEFRARVEFLYDGYWYVGCQHTSVTADFKAWDFWRAGRWRGPAASRSVPGNLSVSGMTLDESVDGAPVANVSSGDGLVASFDFLYGQLDEFSLEYQIYGDAFVAVGTSLDLPSMADGSYLFWLRLAGVVTAPLTAGQYKILTGFGPAFKYEYTENGQAYFWDYDRNLGRLPSDTTSGLYTLRASVVASGTQLDRPEWARFITSADGQGNEWSLLRLQVGGGTWTLPSAAVVSPGSALLRKATSAAFSDPVSAVDFDAAARSVSAWCIKSDGNLLIAGNRASRSGPQLALWEYDGTTWVLVGLNANLSNGFCECSLSDHTCGRIVQGADGTIYVLTKCSMHRFYAAGTGLIDRLPEFPASTGGHPGGQCLQDVDGVLWWLTENFGGIAGVTDTAQFYNTLESLAIRGTTRKTGIGTICHNANSMTQYRGSLTGMVQDKPFSAPTARGRMAVIEGTRWNNTEPGWDAASTTMQGLETARGLLFCYGVETQTELPLAAIFDPGGTDGDGALQFARFGYRIEHMSRVLVDGHEEILALGKSVTDPTVKPDDLPYVLIRIPMGGTDGGGGGGGFAHICLLWSGVYFAQDVSQFTDDGIDTAELPSYMAFSPQPGTIGYWVPSATMPAAPYLSKSIVSGEVRYTLHGTAPYDFAVFSRICFNGGDPDWWPPEPNCDNADCAINQMPDGTKYLAIECVATTPWWALQVDDVDPQGLLRRDMEIWPCLWLSLDQTADPDDLGSYDFWIRRIDDNGRVNLPRQINPGEKVRVLMLWPPTLDGEPYTAERFSVQPVE